MFGKTIYGKLEKEKDVYSIVASTGDMDRDGEKIMPSAFKNLKAYLSTNPVILFAHNYYDPPIAKATSGKITDNGLRLNIKFAETDFGKEIKYLYDEGFMNSFSVGFIPKNWDRDPDGTLVFTEVELLEVSAVPVPANAQANMIRTLEERGVDLPNFKKCLNIDSVVENGEYPVPKGERGKAETHINKLKKIYGGLK